MLYRGACLCFSEPLHPPSHPSPYENPVPADRPVPQKSKEQSHHEEEERCFLLTNPPQDTFAFPLASLSRLTMPSILCSLRKNVFLVLRQFSALFSEPCPERAEIS